MDPIPPLLRGWRHGLSGVRAFGSIPLAETEISIEAGPQIVAIESVNVLAIVFDENIFEGRGNGRCGAQHVNGDRTGWNRRFRRLFRGMKDRKFHRLCNDRQGGQGSDKLQSR